MADELTKDVVRMAYRLMLGREPENEQVVNDALNYGSVSAMRMAFLRSDEFRTQLEVQRVPELTPLASPRLKVEWRAEEEDAAALLSHVARTWNRLGAERPHWSVLSADRFAPDSIDRTRDAFFRSGSWDRDVLLAVLRRAGLTPTDYKTVFEFGCGLARVTPFLAESFSRVLACDVSSTHISVAKDVLRESGNSNVTVALATVKDFGMKASFDLWFSRLVLQHNPPPIMAMVLRRALTLLNPGGIAHFQIPTYADGYRFQISEYMSGLSSAAGIEMHVLPMPAIFEILEATGCQPLEVWQDNSAGDPPAWISSVITARKRPAR